MYYLGKAGLNHIENLWTKFKSKVNAWKTTNLEKNFTISSMESSQKFRKNYD